MVAPDRERAAAIERAIEEAARLEAEGALRAALDRLTEHNRQLAAPELERRLVALRRAAFVRRSAADSSTRISRDASRGAPCDAARGVPVLRRSELSAALVRDTLAAHGVLMVSGLFDAAQVARLRSIVESAFEARRAAHAGSGPTTSGWFDEVPDVDPFGRRYIGDIGMYICDTPKGLFELLEVYRDAGVLDLVSGYFGESIALMPEKCTLRKVPPMTAPEWDEAVARFGDSESAELWHQDGRMFGEGVEALDVWATLSPCGRRAPGLEVVPSNAGRLLPVDDARAFGTISPTTLAKSARAMPVLPELEPGDAVFLDQLTVHSTGHRRGMVDDRWSVEGWFFGESRYPATGAALAI